MHEIPIPATRTEAIEALVALDVAKWGERYREGCHRHYAAYPSYGRLLNALARRPEYDFGDAVPHLVAAARKALTSADWNELRKGG